MIPIDLPTRSQLRRRIERGDFWWSTGIEDSFITAPHRRTGRTLDEYELTQHYRRRDEDLRLMAQLEVPCVRYGIPWHRIQPQPRRWDWKHADEPLERLLDLGIAPQVDLVHYGLPGWIDSAYCNPDYPSLVAEYAARVADRFKGRIHWYTPLNEPRVTAYYCGRLGWWPPNLRSWRGFVLVLLAIARGIQETVAALERVDPEILAYHVDATDLYDAAEPELEEQAEWRRQLVFLPLDLVSGRVDDRHPLHGWLLRNGAREKELHRLIERAVEPEIIGLNLYPMFTAKRVVRDSSGRARIRMRYSEDELISRVAWAYWQRYQVPLTISETATRGSVSRRLAWLDRSIGQIRDLRAEGVALCGYTWWPMFSLVAWSWRQGFGAVEDYLEPMGLWDLDPQMNRRRTCLVDAFRNHVSGGRDSVGPLEPGNGRNGRP